MDKIKQKVKKWWGLYEDYIVTGLIIILASVVGLIFWVFIPKFFIISLIAVTIYLILIWNVSYLRYKWYVTGKFRIKDEWPMFITLLIAPITLIFALCIEFGIWDKIITTLDVRYNSKGKEFMLHEYGQSGYESDGYLSFIQELNKTKIFTSNVNIKYKTKLGDTFKFTFLRKKKNLGITIYNIIITKI